MTVDLSEGGLQVEAPSRVALGSAVLGYWILSLLVVAPLLRIRDMAARFGAGDLAARDVALNSFESGCANFATAKTRMQKSCNV